MTGGGRQPRAMSGVDARLARVLEFQRETTALLAEEVTAIPEGWLVRNHSLPLVWGINHVRVSRPLQFADALALVDRHQATLPYRQLVIEPPASGERLEAQFRADGWGVDREVTMALASGADREVDTTGVAEPSEEQALELMSRWIREDDTVKLTPEAHRQLVEFNRLAWRARRARRLGAWGRSGALAAITMLFSDWSIAQVEDVYTVPEERDRGLARALLTRAGELAREGGHELTFIVADDQDWPKQLYARVGFEPIGRSWLFHREVR